MSPGGISQRPTRSGFILAIQVAVRFQLRTPSVPLPNATFQDITRRRVLALAVWTEQRRIKTTSKRGTKRFRGIDTLVTPHTFREKASVFYLLILFGVQLRGSLLYPAPHVRWRNLTFQNKPVNTTLESKKNYNVSATLAQCQIYRFPRLRRSLRNPKKNLILASFTNAASPFPVITLPTQPNIFCTVSR